MESSWSHAGRNEGRCSCGGCTAPSETALVWKHGLKAWSQSLSSLVLVKVKCLLSGALSEPASSAAMCPPNAGQDAQLPPGCLDRHMGCNPWPKQAGSSQLLPSLGLAVGVGPGRAVGHDAGGWQGVLLKAAPCWEAGSRTCCAGAALCFFFFVLVVFLKMVPFAILPVFHKTFPGRTSPKLLGIQLLEGVGVKDICASVQC